MKILIVDDSRAMRLVVRRALRQAGYGNHDVEEAENGIEGLAVVRRFGPDLVLSDWNMPEMNGIEFLQALRCDGNGVPFGFITTEGTEDKRQEALGAGANFLLAKPFTPEQVSAALSPYVR
jgi:two-component system chemotaxis response regulator CheY